MPYNLVKMDDGYKVCKGQKSLKAKKECFSKQPLTKSNARQQQKALYASEHGPTSNRNKANALWQVMRGDQMLMSGVTASRLAPYVSQMSAVGATQIIAALKNGAYHKFGPITVSLHGDIEGEGVLNWINKKLSQTSLFKPDVPKSGDLAQNQSAPIAGPRAGIELPFPADTKTLYQMNTNVYANKAENVGDWQYMDGTAFVQFYRKGNDIIIAIRGTADARDVVADVNIALRNLSNTARFKDDLATVQKFEAEHSADQYTYYFTGHSLGGAIIDELLARNLGVSAISFNPAVQKNFYNSKNHKRIYNTEDPLYQLMGQYVPTAEVREFKQDNSFVNKALSYIPILGDARQMLKGHSLSNYSGGKMPTSITDRPYMRGAGPLCSGAGWFDTALEKLGSVALPAMSIGTMKLEDVKRGDYTPKFGRIPEYAIDSADRILRARSGDSSGIMEKLQGEGMMCPANYDPVTDPETGIEYGNKCKMMVAKQRKIGVGGAYCSWVEEQGRYGPKWVEKCEGNGYFYNNEKHGRVYCANC